MIREDEKQHRTSLQSSNSLARMPTVYTDSRGRARSVTSNLLMLAALMVMSYDPLPERSGTHHRFLMTMDVDWKAIHEKNETSSPMVVCKTLIF